MHNGSRPRASVQTLARAAMLVALILLPLPASEAALPKEQAGRRDFFVLEDRYRKILVKWAESGPESLSTGSADMGSADMSSAGMGSEDMSPGLEAVTALATFELDLQWHDECLDVLLEHVILRLEAEDPETLPALAVLYRETYLHLAGGLELSTAGGMIPRLLSVLTATAEASAPRGASFATDLLILTAFQDVSQRYPQLLVHARTLLEAAVEVGEPDDSETLPALAWLAFLEEIDDRPARAVRRLESLREVVPEDREILLRLALNLLRSGREDRAEPHLRELVEAQRSSDPSSDWVQLLAIEELARLLAERGEREPARALLERELEEHPGEQSLATLLASLQPRWSASFAVLQEMLEHRDGNPGTGARWRYEQGPVDRLQGIPERIEAEWTASRPKLERVLESQSLSEIDEPRLREMERFLGVRGVRRLIFACHGTLAPIDVKARPPGGVR